MSVCHAVRRAPVTGDDWVRVGSWAVPAECDLPVLGAWRYPTTGFSMWSTGLHLTRRDDARVQEVWLRLPHDHDPLNEELKLLDRWDAVRAYVEELALTGELPSDEVVGYALLGVAPGQAVLSLPDAVIGTAAEFAFDRHDLYRLTSLDSVQALANIAAGAVAQMRQSLLHHAWCIAAICTPRAWSEDHDTKKE